MLVTTVENAEVTIKAYYIQHHKCLYIRNIKDGYAYLSTCL